MKKHPLASFRFCPFCGKNHLDFSDEKSILCHDCGQRFYGNTAGAVAAIIANDDGKILFTRRKHEPAMGMLDFPGGFIDLNESAEEALHREIEEELRVNIKYHRYLGSFPNQYTYKGITYHTIDMIFLCKVNSMETIFAGDDIESYEFRCLNETNPEEMGLESMKSVLIFLKSANYSDIESL